VHPPTRPPQVNFPKTLDAGTVEALRGLLPAALPSSSSGPAPMDADGAPPVPGTGGQAHSAAPAAAAAAVAGQVDGAGGGAGIEGEEFAEPCVARHVADGIEAFRDVVQERARVAAAASSNAYDEDEDDDGMLGRGGQRVQCAQQ
jgi:hypothetical protein